MCKMRSHREVSDSASTIAIFVTQRKWPNAFSPLAIYGQLNVVYALDGDEEVVAKIKKSLTSGRCQMAVPVLGRHRPCRLQLKFANGGMRFERQLFVSVST